MCWLISRDMQCQYVGILQPPAQSFFPVEPHKVNSRAASASPYMSTSFRPLLEFQKECNFKSYNRKYIVSTKTVSFKVTKYKLFTLRESQEFISINDKLYWNVLSFRRTLMTSHTDGTANLMIANELKVKICQCARLYLYSDLWTSCEIANDGDWEEDV